ncbi:Phosphoribosyl-dephospho-CoA transferase [Paraburkholderia caffeinitolerans]|uniref:Phosphoribosyl-dephospho-CoA transferase n=1 Tax=Paraburkholderia caffeinitolerans TaxID=1723730 RepID=A0A6J5GGP7_9BURK|nr:malonate decarboxylase holo-ACP synthase [Paraburkholderia caffeinitolerans]CAB3797565.1 Phosphoribosyl-dephospho-CoA transferase [Paraburkholderia caffeinitolerans]
MRVCAAPPFAPDAPRTDDVRWRPHDLLRLARLTPVPDEPAWVREAFARAPFAVVRRAQAASGFVAAGLRGGARGERFGTWIDVEDIESSASPESLLATAPSSGRTALTAFVALASLRESPGPLRDFVWGPTGSAGFELATQVSTLTESSDLDLLIRMPQRSHATTIQALAATLARAAQHAGTRVDAQLETPAGSVALAELLQWATGKTRVLARASDGARLVADPWQTS